jgi:hypothetical protein
LSLSQCKVTKMCSLASACLSIYSSSLSMGVNSRTTEAVLHELWYWGVLLKFITIFLFWLKVDKMMDTLYESLHVFLHTPWA